MAAKKRKAIKPSKPKTKKPVNKSPKIFKFAKKQPEQVFRAKVKAKSPPTVKVSNIKSWLNNNLSTILAVILVLICFVFVFFITKLYLKQKQDNQFYNDLQSKNGLMLQDINTKKELIGSKSRIISEIVNYQSAPEDLQDYVVRDYAVFKSKCIVNGQFIGPTYYEIAAVAYDSYAKVLMDCEGQDAQILVKIGGKWVVAHAGQDAPDCNDVNSLAIPMGIAPTCTDGKILYPNPNP